MADKENIRPIYSELQGYLSQAPASDKQYLIGDPALWEQINETINELARVSGENYERFGLTPGQSGGGGKKFLDTNTYRAKIGGLISKLHGKYFPDEPAPFTGMPSTVISQTQQQSQSVHVQMLLEVQSKIDQKLPEFGEGTKERTFLQKVKGSLSSIKDTMGLILLLVNVAKECGLSIDDLKSIFG
jgi:hypothetical protein